jgi:hypothetical protein
VTSLLQDAAREASETLEWIKDWRDGQFTPAHTEDGWTVEMYGLVGSAETIALALLKAQRALEAVRQDAQWATDVLHAGTYKAGGSHPGDRALAYLKRILDTWTAE